MPTDDERLFSMLIYVLSFPLPILGPLLVWLLKRDQSEFVDYHGKEYFNFFLSYTIYGIIGTVLILLLIGIVVLIVLGIMGLIFTIMAAVRSYQGERYRFPLIIRFIS
ncbi:DUF4870 domain-containing protein [Virgibacillus ainsalahensis]